MKTAVAFAACATADAAVLRGQKFHLEAHMQPELVAKTFKKVEDNWRSEAFSFAECTASPENGDCAASSQRFVDSCTTLVSSIVKASSGQRSVVQEYMGDICAEPVLEGWHRASCGEFATSLISAMGVDSLSNREDMKSQAMCTKLWKKFSVEQSALVEKERAERAEEEKKAAEAQAKQEAEERARAAKEEEEQRKAAEASAAEEAKAKAEQEAAEKKAAEEAAAKEAADKAAADKAAEENAVAKANETQSQNASTVVSAEASSNATAVNATVDSHSDGANSSNATDVAAMADQIAANAVANSTVAVAVASNATSNQTNATIMDAPVDSAVALASNASNSSVTASVETNSTKA